MLADLGLNMWLIAATALIVGLIPCGVVCVMARRSVDRLVALEMTTILSVLILLLLAKGFHRPSFFDLALTMALLSIPGTLIFVHYLERWS